MSGGQIEFEVIRDSEGLRDLRDAWDALWARSANEYYELSHSVVWHAWDRVAESQGHRLCTIVGRNEGRVVLIWPAILRREKFQGIWRVATWLGRDPIDYGSVLVEPGPQSAAWLTDALSYLGATSGADVLSLASVPAGNVVQPLLAQHCSAGLQEDPAPFIDLCAWSSWSEYEVNLPKSFRKNLQRRARRLAEAGKVKFDLDADADTRTLHETVDWITRHKKDWLKQRGIEHWQLTSAEYADAMVRTLSEAPRGKILVSRLLVDGATVAADINLVSGDRFYSDYGSFDLEWSKYSPGALLMREVIQWAFEHNLKLLDLGRGADDYKLKWSSGVTPIGRFLYPCNLRGRIYVHLRTSRLAHLVARRRAAA